MISYIQHVLEIEEVKKEADRLMIAKVTKYENEIATVKAKHDDSIAAIKSEHTKDIKRLKMEKLW